MHNLATAALLVGLTVLQDGPAEVIFHSGKVITMNASADIVEAVAVREGKILAVGSDEQVKSRFGGAGTRFVDLSGRTVLPGFYDNHIHVGGLASVEGRDYEASALESDPGRVSLWGVRDLDDLKERIRRRAAELPRGSWISGAIPLGEGASEPFREGSRPTRWDLDEAAPDHPVALLGSSSTGVVNSLALERAGIDRFTPQPFGGWIERDSTGEPTGILRGAGPTFRLVRSVMPPPVAVSDDAMLRLLREQLREQLSLGVTSVNVAGVLPGSNLLRLLQRLYATCDSLPRMTVQVRLRPGYDAHGNLDEGVIIRKPLHNSKRSNSRLDSATTVSSSGAIKLSTDDGITGLSLWQLEAYRRRDYYGGVRIPPVALYPVIKRAHQLGWQIGVHVVGDAAIQATVDVFERVLAENPRAGHRHYLHHMSMLPPEQTLRKMAALEIIAAAQPNFLWSLAKYYQDAFPGDHRRLATIHPGATLQRYGIAISYGSDGVPYGPLVGIWAATTRTAVDGEVWGPDERISVIDAIRYYTLGTAYLTFDEDTKGSLEVGKLADMVVLSQDIISIPADDIRNISVDLTIVGGNILFGRVGQCVTGRAATARPPVSPREMRRR